MLTEKQLGEIREHLDRAQNPIFFYDNDADGLCSFVILRRFLDRGKGVSIRSFPDLNRQYAKKVEELGGDYVFILDKPVLSDEFIEEIGKMGLPIVWIDHHEVQAQEKDEKSFEERYDNFYCYNPAKNLGKDKSDEPVTYLAYKVAGRVEDRWLAVIGCISDHYLPDFAEEFGKEKPELWGPVEKPFDAYFGTEIGRIAQGFNFGLKDSTSNIVRFQNFLIGAKGPEDVFSEVKENYSFRKKYGDIKKRFDSLIKKAKEDVGEKLVFFSYGGDMSISSEVANRLNHDYPDKYVVVGYKKGGIVNLSLRGKGVRNVLDKILKMKEFEGCTGGGHEDAVGSRIGQGLLEKFREVFEKEIGEK
tara:strand:- start:744 stop:1823 length:1080 start_codon:yes stop_codon:yes gene_type:complete